MAEFFKVAGLMLFSSVKFLFSPSTVYFSGYNYVETIAITIIGGWIGVVLFYYAGTYIVDFTNRLFNSSKKKRSFRKRNRWIILVKNRFGVVGLALISPSLISIPLGCLLAAKYFRNDRPDGAHFYDRGGVLVICSYLTFGHCWPCFLITSVRHIFFDLDRTLWDFETNSRQTLRELYVEFDLEAQGRGNQEYFVERYIMHNDRLWDLYRQEKVTKGRLRKERFRRALEDVGVEDSRVVNHFSKRYMEVCPSKPQLVEGAMEVVEALKPHYHLHILTNGFQEAQTRKLTASGLAPFFEHVITSERASSRKPKPRIYEVAMQITGAPKEESLMIGDHLEIDVRGAINAGWKAIHYNCDGIEHDLQAVTKLEDLRALLL